MFVLEDLQDGQRLRTGLVLGHKVSDADGLVAPGRRRVNKGGTYEKMPR